MKRIIKSALILLLLAAAGWAGVSVINLYVDKPAEMPAKTLLGKTTLFKDAAPVIQESCLNCHSSKTQFPWYAKLPPMKQIIEHNIEEGREEINLEKELFTPGRKPSAKALRHIREVINEGEMPPLEYAALHWKAFLTRDEKRAVLDWLNEQDAGGKPLFEPLKPVPVNEEKAALGKMLFHDRRLSGDGTVSCATCHALNKGGTDQMAGSIGIRGQKGPISAPTVYNAHLNFVQFWDGRAANLQEQALGPVTNPLEMGGDWEKILPVLNADPVYRGQFAKIYGRSAFKEDVADAIAEFEKTLVTLNSPFDRYLKGDESALTDKQKLGFRLFKDIGCTSCHYGQGIGGNSFEKMGRRKNYFEDRGNMTDADLGLFNHTKKESDKHFFKVPLLRNVGATYPYFHDGGAKTLDEAVRKMAYYQNGRKLTNSEAEAIVEYLNSLTGEYEGKRVE